MNHILVVDDDPNTLASVARAFRMAGYEATVCDSAARALQLMAATRFDVVLSDVVMPGMDGIAMLEQLRAAGVLTPVIMISGQANVEMAVTLVLCSAIMLGGGGLMFGIHWRQPLALLALTLGYISFAAALMAFLSSLVPDERRAAVFDNLAGMALGLVGGCAFPPQQLPAFLREHITPLLPSYWFADAARQLEAGMANVAWGVVALKLAGLGLALVGLAALMFGRRFKKGLRA